MNNRKMLTGPYLVWAAGFIILPLFMIVYYGLTNASGAFTFENLFAIVDPIHLKALWRSIYIAFLSTVICLLLAYPLAYILSKYQGSKSGVIIMLFILPMWINFLLRTMALQMIISNTGLLNAVLGFFGIKPLHIMNTTGAILIGMVYDYFPFMVLPIYNALCKIDRDLINAAHDLGANNVTTFQKVIFPLSLPGVLSGIIMVFIPAISEFVIADILGGSKILLIGNVIEQEFSLTNNWNLGSGLSLVLMVFIFVSMAIMNKYDKTGEGQLLW
ncbi:MAG: ABC transporter permease [Lachnospiraceae bacterium]|nr:ABC transporter permease [Lachnospiraceae bacterium]